jgi:hypothetical protein
VQNEVVFSPVGGNYPGLKKVNVQIPNGWKVFYTRDGKTPNKSAEKVNKEITLNGDEALYFAMYKGNNPPIYTSNTYITSRKQTLPIFSIITDPYHLFDSLTGIYEMGCCAESKLPFKGANFWKDIEKPIHVEFIDNNVQAFSQSAGIKIFGGYSVSMPQKSFAIYARKKYGDNRFRYPLFPQLPFNEYKNFVLRNSGGDMQGAHIRDAYATQLTKSSEIAYQEYRPVVVYINGKYWGIYSLREKINEHFINAHFDIKKSNVSIVRPPNKVNEGPKASLKEYNNLMRFLKDKETLTNEDIYKVQKEIDIADYLKYNIIQVYLGNSDASRNIRLYKDVNKKTPFKTVLFDLDMGLNIFDENKHKENALKLFTSAEDTNIQYPREYTLLLRKLLTNDSIRYQYINYFIDAMNTQFKPLVAQGLLTQLTGDWKAEIGHHRKRWNITELRYNRSMNRIQTFIQERPEIILGNLKEFFEINETFELKVYASEGGKVYLNSLKLSSDYSANYFKGIPIQYKAVPDENYEFVGWKNKKNQSIKQYVNVNTQSFDIEPIFKQKKAPWYFNKIILSELNIAQSKTVNYSDWIEIYNISEDTIDLSNWVLKDDNDQHIFKLKKGTLILPKSYLILTKNRAEFLKKFGNQLYVIGDIGFGYNNRKDKIRLYDDKGFLIIQLETNQLPKLEDRNKSLIRTGIQSSNSITKQWIEAVPSPGAKVYNQLGEKVKDRNKFIANTFIFYGIIFGLLVVILFFIILATYIGKDKA